MPHAILWHYAAITRTAGCLRRQYSQLPAACRLLST